MNDETVFGDTDLACHECGKRNFRPDDKGKCQHCGVGIKWSAVEKRWVARDD